MNFEEMEKFRKAYETFYIERFLYGSAEVEASTKEERLSDMRRMLNAYRYLINKTGRLNINDVKIIGEMVNDDTVCPGFRRTDVTAGDKALFEPAIKQQVITRLNDLFYNYYYMWDGLDPFEREARFHIKYIRIHPLENGNKRTGRLILTTNLSKQGKPPVIITDADTDFYYKLINECNYTEFAEFLAHRSSLEDNTMCGFYKARNGLDVLSDVDAKELRKSLVPKNNTF